MERRGRGLERDGPHPVVDGLAEELRVLEYCMVPIQLWYHWQNYVLWIVS